jgi:hypothetical protein
VPPLTLVARYSQEACFQCGGMDRPVAVEPPVSATLVREPLINLILSWECKKATLSLLFVQTPVESVPDLPETEGTSMPRQTPTSLYRDDLESLETAIVKL